MIGYYLMLAVLGLIAAALNYVLVDAAKFWGALAMTVVYAGILAAVAGQCS